jgi:hypothetical protein
MQNTNKKVTKVTPQATTVTPQAPTLLLTQSQSQHKQALLQAKQNVANAVPIGAGVTHHTAGTVVKGLLPQPQIAKPTLAMCFYIPQAPQFKYTQGQCQHRKHLYHAGFSLLHAKLAFGLTPNDLTYWGRNVGAVTLTPPTNAQYLAIVNAWQQGLLIPSTYCPITGNLLAQGNYTSQAIPTIYCPNTGAILPNTVCPVTGQVLQTTPPLVKV